MATHSFADNMANLSNLDKSIGKLAICLAAIGAEGEAVVDAGAEYRLDLRLGRAHEGHHVTPADEGTVAHF